MKQIFCKILVLTILVFMSWPVWCEELSAHQYYQLTIQRSQQASGTKDLKEQSKLAHEGLDFADKCLAIYPKHVGCVYFRGVNRGLELETKITGIKKELQKIIDDFLWVVRVNDHFREGSAYLALGNLYLRLPTIPLYGEAFTRDLNKANDYAQKALAISRDNPENLKLAGQVAYKRHQYEQALGYFKLADDNKKKFRGPDYDEFKDDLKKWIKKTKRKLKIQG